MYTMWVANYVCEPRTVCSCMCEIVDHMMFIDVSVLRMHIETNTVRGAYT